MERYSDIGKRFLTSSRPIFGGKTLKVTAKEAALSHGVPNFFFHLNAGYAILRSKGVPVGKADYLGSFVAQ